MNILPQDKIYREQVLTRFWNAVEKSDDCWNWQRNPGTAGYGRMRINSKKHAVHRISWEIHYGPIPQLADADYRGTCVCHHCDNRICVNPKHLFLATHKENMKDASSKKRMRSIPQYGEDNPAAKLTTEEVVKIRELYKTNNYTQQELANLFGISFQHIHRIVRNKRWQWLI